MINTAKLNGTLKPSAVIFGSIKNAEPIAGKVSSSFKLKGTLKNVIGLSGYLAIGVLAPEYTGATIVTPSAGTEQTLNTSDKILRDDITVKKVPYYETSNDYGETVYIASEV